MRAFFCLAAFAAALLLSSPSGLAQGQAPGIYPGAGVSAAPLPVTLDIRDAATPPTPERIPKPFVPGKKQAAPKKKNKRPTKPKATQQAPKQSAAMPSANAQDIPQAQPEAPQASTPMDRPPLVTPPREKISPIVPYIDDAPPAEGRDTGQGMGQTGAPNDFKAATKDTSPELSPSPAQSPDAAPAASPEAAPIAAPIAAPEAAPSPQPTASEPPRAPQTAPAPQAAKP